MKDMVARQPMTGGEREILWQVEKLFARWLDTVSMGLHREANTGRKSKNSPQGNEI